MSRVDDALNRLADGSGAPPRVWNAPAATLEDYPTEPRAATDVSPPPAEPESPTQPAVMPMPKVVAPRPRPEARLSKAHGAASDRTIILSGQVPPVTIEQYRRLAAALHEAQEDRGLKCLMVASALPNDGKTLTAINLSLTLSESYGQRVLLVDADLRRPSIHRVLKLSNRTGLTDLLRSTERGSLPIIELSSCLSVLPAGREDASPLAGLTSGRMKEILNEASAAFDWVIIDTPPLGLLPDAQVVARLADAVLLVVAAGITPYLPVQRAIADVGIDRIIGVVLNRADGTTTMSSYYESYYITSDVKRPESHG